MRLLLFWLFSILMLAFAFGIVTSRNTIISAMNLVVSFIFLACLFFTLDAFFIGIAQVLIYAGAVMVLFLFIVMLLFIKNEEQRSFNKTMLATGIMTMIGFCLVLTAAVRTMPSRDIVVPTLLPSAADDVTSVGLLLFLRYNLPFQVMGVLLLVATLGIILLSKDPE